MPQVVDAVKVPVIAAGGVADGRQVAAAFMLGASGVQMGTAFLRCEEANVLDAHRAALREANDACTVVTDMITGRPARYIRNKLTDDLIASGLEPVSFPAQLSLTAPLGATGDREVTALFAGQSAALGKDTNAAALVEGSRGRDFAPTARIHIVASASCVCFGRFVAASPTHALAVVAELRRADQMITVNTDRRSEPTVAHNAVR